MSDPETITEAELAEALTERLRRCGGSHLIISATSEAAAEIFEEARRNREPEYEPGAVYEAADGGAWFRLRPAMTQDTDVRWRHCESGSVYAERAPKRPLRKLVPAPARDALLAALEESLAREHGYEGQANRVYALLEGRTDDDD